MAGCKEFECFVCGKCKEEPTIESKYTAEPEAQITPEERIQTEGQMADATIVYVLGYLEDDPSTKQVDEYSGLNGYHIRTIPGKRWNIPVMIGAGAGYLAVVDRFTDYDLIRVTDKYGGAGIDGFDADGFPLDSIDWASLPDVCSQATPTGTRVIGLKITPRGMLIAHLSNTSTYLKFDVVGRAIGKIAQVMEGTKTLKKPFDTLGTLTGTPAFVDANIGSRMFYTVSLIRSNDGNQIIAGIIDTIQHKVVGLQGIPATPTPITATISNNVMSVLCGDNGIATQVIRFVVNPKGGGLIAGTKSGKVTPTPQEYTVEQFPKVKDFRGRTFTPEQLNTYYRIASKINESANADNRTIPLTFENLPVINESSTVLNDNQVSAEAHVTSEYYSKAMHVPVHIIPISESLGLKTIEGGYGTITELFNRRTGTGVMDREKPIIRVLHGGHYDIVSEGGYTYGSPETPCTNGMVGESLATDKDYELGKLKTPGDAKAALIDANTGLILYRHPKPLFGFRVYGGDYASLDPLLANNPLIAEIEAIQDDINRLYGTFEQAIADGRATYALDIYNERITNLTWKSTLSARLTTIGTTGISVKRTEATTNAETLVKIYDGIERRKVKPWLSPWLYPDRITPNGDPVDAFYTNPNNCADDFWTMFLRRPAMSNKFDAGLTRKTWSTLVPNADPPIFLPEWVSKSNPIQSMGSFSMLVSPKTISMLKDSPIQFNYVGRGGFYALNAVSLSMMSNLDRYNEEISSLQQFNHDYQYIMNVENAKPPAQQNPSIIAQYSGYVSENNTRIDQLNIWLGSKTEHESPMIPRRTLLTVFRGLDKSVGQTTPYTPEVMIPLDKDIAYAGKWQTTAIGESTIKKRGCIIESGPQAWIAITLNMQADSMEGVDVWQYPETRRNGLGIRAGALDWENLHPDYASAFDIIGGSVYAAGWRTYAKGSWASWGYRVEGAPYSVSDPLLDQYSELIPTNAATIRMAAPADAQDTLLEDLYGGDIGNITSEIFVKRLYFMSKIPIKKVKVKFWLMHHALDVFRFGYRTLYFGSSLGASHICPKTDPGYWAGNNCEASACGNITCSSALFGGNHKLYSNDPVFATVDRPIMSGTAVFTCDNPYDGLGLAYGTIWKCNVNFDLNNNVRGFDIPLEPSQEEKAKAGI